MNNKSFTLIEILVVIVVIGILSGFVLIITNDVTESTYDAERKHDIDNLQKLILSYKTLFGTAPVEATECDIRNDVSGCTTLKSALIPDYAQAFPTDPSGAYYKYQSADGSDFTIKATLSNDNLYKYTYSSGFSEITPQQMIINGGFETGNSNGWTKTGSYAWADIMGAGKYSGSYGAIIYCEYGTGTFYQTVDLTNVSQLSFWSKNGTGHSFKIDSDVKIANLYTSSWSQHIIDVSSYSGSHTITFSFDNTGMLYLDDVSAMTN